MTSIRNAPVDIASARILHYLRTHNYDDGAVYINRLGAQTFRKILANDISIDVLLAQLPFSIEIFEVIYSKVFIHDPDTFPIRILKPEQIISKMISVFASSLADKPPSSSSTTTTVGPPTKAKQMGVDDERLLSNLSSILRIISYVQPVLFKRLLRQKETIDDCILHFEQRSSHSSSTSTLQKSTSTSSLVPKPLEDTIRQELESAIVCCQQALHRLESKRFASQTTLSPASTPAASRKNSTISTSHSPSSFDDVQTRLFQHKAILNVVEPYLSRTKLYTVIDNLGQKVSIDKKILLAYAHIKSHEKQIAFGETLLPLFKRFAFAYERVIQLWRRVTDSTLIDECNDDVVIDSPTVANAGGGFFERARSRK